MNLNIFACFVKNATTLRKSLSLTTLNWAMILFLYILNAFTWRIIAADLKKKACKKINYCKSCKKIHVFSLIFLQAFFQNFFYFCDFWQCANTSFWTPVIIHMLHFCYINKVVKFPGRLVISGFSQSPDITNFHDNILLVQN